MIGVFVGHQPYLFAGHFPEKVVNKCWIGIIFIGLDQLNPFLFLSGNISACFCDFELFGSRNAFIYWLVVTDHPSKSNFTEYFPDKYLFVRWIPDTLDPLFPSGTVHKHLVQVHFAPLRLRIFRNVLDANN